MLNFAAVSPAAFGYFTAYPSGTAAPVPATVIFAPSQGVVAGGMTLPLSTAANDLAITASLSGVHVIVDVYGYFE